METASTADDAAGPPLQAPAAPSTSLAEIPGLDVSLISTLAARYLIMTR
jgi:hypothetical protein